MSRKSLLCLRRHLAPFCSHFTFITDYNVLAYELPTVCSSNGCALSHRRFITVPEAAFDSRAARLIYAAAAPCISSHQKRSFIGEGVPAKHYHERKLLGYTQQQLYNVVSDVANYKEFIPWCQRSVVLQQKLPDFVEAELEVGFKMFVERYTSQVYLTEPSKVLSKVSDSTLFDHLDTSWEFKAGPTPSTTWLNFDIDFAFKSPLYRQIAGIFFDEVVKRMMNAFEGRCKQLYGESSIAQKRRMQA